MLHCVSNHIPKHKDSFIIKHAYIGALVYIRVLYIIMYQKHTISCTLCSAYQMLDWSVQSMHHSTHQVQSLMLWKLYHQKTCVNSYTIDYTTDYRFSIIHAYTYNIDIIKYYIVGLYKLQTDVWGHNMMLWIQRRFKTKIEMIGQKS